MRSMARRRLATLRSIQSAEVASRRGRPIAQTCLKALERRRKMPRTAVALGGELGFGPPGKLHPRCDECGSPRPNVVVPSATTPPRRVGGSLVKRPAKFCATPPERQSGDRPGRSGAPLPGPVPWAQSSWRQSPDTPGDRPETVSFPAQGGTSAGRSCWAVLRIVGWLSRRIML